MKKMTLTSFEGTTYEIRFDNRAATCYSVNLGPNVDVGRIEARLKYTDRVEWPRDDGLWLFTTSLERLLAILAEVIGRNEL